MSLLDNQSFKRKKQFLKIGDNEKSITLSFTVTCNHEISKSMISDLENYISTLLLKNYENADDIKKQLEQKKLLDKQNKLKLKQQQKLQQQKEKDEKNFKKTFGL